MSAPITEREAMLAARLVQVRRENDRPTPERLRAWAEWFADRRPLMSDPFYVVMDLAPSRLRKMADALEASEGERA